MKCQILSLEYKLLLISGVESISYLRYSCYNFTLLVIVPPLHHFLLLVENGREMMEKSLYLNLLS